MHFASENSSDTVRRVGKPAGDAGEDVAEEAYGERLRLRRRARGRRGDSRYVEVKFLKCFCRDREYGRCIYRLYGAVGIEIRELRARRCNILRDKAPVRGTGDIVVVFE